MTTTQQPGRRANQDKRSLWPTVSGPQIAGLFYATVWLVFLASPVMAAAYSDVHLGLKLLAWAATGVFALVYVWQMARLFADDHRNHPAPSRLAVICVALAAIGALTIPAAGTWAVTFCVYIAALIIFTSPPMVGIPIGVGVWAVSTAAAYLISGETEVWIALGPGLGMLFIVVIRTTEHYEDRARAVEQQLRTSEERDRIARDVHDVLGHSLTVLSIKAQVARRLMETEPQRAQAELDEIEQLARSSLSQVRTTVTRLRAPQLPEELEVARTALEAGGISADIHAEEEHSESQLLAWTLRETITNVLRHSQASRCRIEIGPESLRVTDDGIGVNGHEGSGLRGLRERAKAEGAQVAVGAGDDASGTRIEVTLA